MIAKIKILKTGKIADALIDGSNDAVYLDNDNGMSYLSLGEYKIEYTASTTSVETKTLCDFFDQQIKKVTVEF